MADDNQSKRMTGALVSGVIYFDEQGEIQEVHWCATPDGESAPADVQPVIRVGGLEEASILLPAMLAELTERFAKAAALEAAKAAKSKKKAVNTGQAAIPQTGQGSEKQAEAGETADVQEPEVAEELEKLQEAPGDDGLEASAEEQPEAKPLTPAKLESKKISNSKELPAMASLFDGLDLS